MRRTKAQIEAANVEVVAPVVASATEAAQSYAMRIWNGQSPDLLRHERIERVTRGLEAQGMSMDNVVLPE